MKEFVVIFGVANPIIIKAMSWVLCSASGETVIRFLDEKGNPIGMFRWTEISGVYEKEDLDASK